MAFVAPLEQQKLNSQPQNAKVNYGALTEKDDATLGKPRRKKHSENAYFCATHKQPGLHTSCL